MTLALNRRHERTITVVAIAVIALARAASAHPGGHDADEHPKYTGYDCSAMSGEFDAGRKGVITVTVFEGKVIFAPKEGTAAVGSCIAPTVSGGKFYPRAQAEFGASFGKGKLHRRAHSKRGQSHRHARRDRHAPTKLPSHSQTNGHQYPKPDSKRIDRPEHRWLNLRRDLSNRRFPGNYESYIPRSPF